MLHELTHLISTANTDDKGGYAWKNSVKYKNYNNAGQRFSYNIVQKRTFANPLNIQTTWLISLW